MAVHYATVELARQTLELISSKWSSTSSSNMTGRILVWEPPRVLEHEYRQAISGESVVRYELAADGDATVLTFTHCGLRAGDAGGFVAMDTGGALRRPRPQRARPPDGACGWMTAGR